MRRKFLALVVCGVIGAGLVANQAFAITQNQALVQSVMEALGFKPVPPPDKIVGAPPKFKVTKAALDKLKKAMDEDKTIVIDAEGKITIE